ncbi:MAG: aromatic amino acid ammonia-lyase [Chitinophagales bacterium]
MISFKRENLDLNIFSEIVQGKQAFQIDANALAFVNKSFDFLSEFAKDKVIYGINTGFGPMAQYRVEDEKGKQLQLNLIRSHASGAGAPLIAEDVRATMLCRLNTLLLGYSGVHESTVNSLKDFLNTDTIPYIPSHGGVGASGDLVQLAHLALTMIGEGEIIEQCRTIPVSQSKNADKIQFAEIKIREGLAIMNGTAAMTGIGLNNILKAQRLLNWSTALSSVINEVMGSYDDHLSKELNGAKKHKGQQKIAATMRHVLADSKSIKQRSESLYNGDKVTKVFKEKVQEYYSLRCVPQILGPVLDTLKRSERILLEEVNSANDNPIIDVANKNVFHGGNFHGDYVSFEMDKLKIAITKLSMLAERQLNYLLNNKLNEKLPPFINLGELGFNFGLQGMQFTATSTTAENQMLSNPMYVHSISNNNDNQDIVSMGTNSALMARKVIDNSFEILAIETIAVCQAIDYLKNKDKLSSCGKKLHELIRNELEPIKEDRPAYNAIHKVTELIKNNALINEDNG